MATDPSTPLFKIEITLPELAHEDFLWALQGEVPWGWEEGTLNNRTVLTVHCEEQPRALRIEQFVRAHYPQAEISIQREDALDWVDAWKDFFTPIEVEELFVVLPPWLGEDGQQTGRSRILINPKTAFGTGHHATTALCLEALARLYRQGVLDRQRHFLDLGTGSGILGIGCALLGLSGLGLDIDPVAVTNAAENRDLNHIAPERFAVATGSLSCLKSTPRFGLIVANILANPLVAMAPGIVDRLNPDGILVLSGILQEQMHRVIKAYQARGLEMPDILTRDEWCALIWSRA